MTDIKQTFREGLYVDQHVIVAGATSGIGLAIAQGFARLGAGVTALGSSAEKIAALGADAGQLRLAQLDVRDREGVKAFCAAQATCHVLVNAAGIARGGLEWEEE